jgi:hypothetical protein
MKRSNLLTPEVRNWVEGVVLDALSNGPMTGAELRDIMGLSNGAANYVIAGLRNAGAIGRRIEPRRRPGRGDKEATPVYYLICHRPGMHCDHRGEADAPTEQEIAERAAVIRAEWDEGRWSQQPKGRPVAAETRLVHVPTSHGSSANEVTRFVEDVEWILDDMINGRMIYRG